MITGGAGFVGSHLAEFLLKKNHELTIITRKQTQNLSNIKNDIVIERFDTSDFKRVNRSITKNKPEIIIHLAGNTSHSKSFEQPLMDIDSNVKSTMNILESLRNSLPKCKFILGSTFVVIGKPQKLPVDENSQCIPTTLYGVNKLSSEFYSKIYNNVYGLDTSIFRITNSFGPREQIIPKKNAVNYLIYKAFNGEKITIYNQGKFYRDLIYISDVVNGINKIITKGKPGELYWISSFNKTWFYELGNLLEKLTDAKIEYVETPSYTKKTDVGNFIANNTKLSKLNWKPKVTVESGIKKTLQFFKHSN